MRWVLVFLVGLPLLMPPGVCLCQFVPCQTPAPAPDKSPEPKQAGCGCHKAQNADHESRPLPKPVEPKPDHLPGCPQVDGVPALQLFTQQADLPVVVVSECLLPCQVLPGVSAQRVPAAECPPLREPLLALYCTLLI